MSENAERLAELIHAADGRDHAAELRDRAAEAAGVDRVWAGEDRDRSAEDRAELRDMTRGHKEPDVDG